MLHSDRLAQSILIGNGGPGRMAHHPLSHLECVKLRDAQKSDAAGLAHVAYATLAEGLSGIKKKRYTWSKVKLYYSAFYCIRAFLLLERISVFYHGRSPHVIRCTPGQYARKASGNTHSVCFALYRDIYKTGVTLSQEIAGQEPLEWLENIRNEASYRTAPMPDPEPPIELKRPASNLRSHIYAYVNDSSYIYAFDPEHALIAFPFY